MLAVGPSTTRFEEELHRDLLGEAPDDDIDDEEDTKDDRDEEE